jgi:hypothetical protein
VVGWGTRVTTVTGSGWTLMDSPLCPPAGSSGGDTGSGSGGGGKGNGKGRK